MNGSEGSFHDKLPAGNAEDCLVMIKNRFRPKWSAGSKMHTLSSRYDKPRQSSCSNPAMLIPESCPETSTMVRMVQRPLWRSALWRGKRTRVPVSARVCHYLPPHYPTIDCVPSEDDSRSPMETCWHSILQETIGASYSFYRSSVRNFGFRGWAASNGALSNVSANIPVAVFRVNV
jgi:hypothetical protein